MSFEFVYQVISTGRGERTHAQPVEQVIRDGLYGMTLCGTKLKRRPLVHGTADLTCQRCKIALGTFTETRRAPPPSRPRV